MRFADCGRGVGVGLAVRRGVGATVGPGSRDAAGTDATGGLAHGAVPVKVHPETTSSAQERSARILDMAITPIARGHCGHTATG